MFSERIADAVHDTIKGLIGTPEAGRILYTGADGTPTKLIDHVSEKAIFDLIEKERCPFRIISEEAGEKITGSSPEHTILIDPVDGTYNACSGIPFYSVSVAIATKDPDNILFGYVRDLATGDTFRAAVGEGAYLNGERIRPSGTRDISSFCISVYGHRSDTEDAASLSKSVRRIRSLGSVALELCYVASGRIDAFADLRGTMRVTDVAAAKLIVEEAGGMITDGYGDSLKLEDQLMNRVKVIASNGHAHDGILKLQQG